MLNPGLVPYQLVAHAVSGLISIALALGTSSAAAAGLLAEALMQPSLEAWRAVLAAKETVLKG